MRRPRRRPLRFDTQRRHRWLCWRCGTEILTEMIESPGALSAAAIAGGPLSPEHFACGRYDDCNDSIAPRVRHRNDLRSAYGAP